MSRRRLDQVVVQKELAPTRSQAESAIKLGQVKVNGEVITKPGYFIDERATLQLDAAGQYVSRAGLKLASVAEALKLDFTDKTVLDVGSSTGGFTDFALQHGAKKVIAVDVGTNQLHPKLRADERVELHEQTDIRDFVRGVKGPSLHIDMVVVDVSFISLREVLPAIVTVIKDNTEVVAMVKPQFEAGKQATNKGVVKNDTMRRTILKDFEAWAKQTFVIKDKADSSVAGAHGNLERFYLLKKANNR